MGFFFLIGGFFYLCIYVGFFFVFLLSYFGGPCLCLGWRILFSHSCALCVVCKNTEYNVTSNLHNNKLPKNNSTNIFPHISLAFTLKTLRIKNYTSDFF